MKSALCRRLPWLLASTVSIISGRIVVDRSRYLRLCSEHEDIEDCLRTLEELSKIFGLEKGKLIIDPRSREKRLVTHDTEKHIELSNLVRNLREVGGEISNYIKPVLVGDSKLELTILDYMFRQCRKYREDVHAILSMLNDVRVSYKIVQYVIDAPELFDEHLFRYALYTALRIGARGCLIYTEHQLGSERIDILIIRNRQESYEYVLPFDSIVIEVKFCKKQEYLDLAGQKDPIAQLERYVRAVKDARPDLNTVLGLIVTNCIAKQGILVELLKRNENWKREKVRLDIVDRESLTSIIKDVSSKHEEPYGGTKPFLYELLNYIMSFPSIVEYKLKHGQTNLFSTDCHLHPCSK